MSLGPLNRKSPLQLVRTNRPCQGERTFSPSSSQQELQLFLHASLTDTHLREAQKVSTPVASHTRNYPLQHQRPTVTPSRQFSYVCCVKAKWFQSAAWECSLRPMSDRCMMSLNIWWDGIFPWLNWPTAQTMEASFVNMVSTGAAGVQ